MEQSSGSVLVGKHFLVVGATGQLGSRIARELSSRGARLTLSGRDRGKLDSLAAELEAGAFPADLTAPAGPGSIIDALGDSMLDGLVCSAGVVAFGPASELDDDTLDELLLTNFVGYARLRVCPRVRIRTRSPAASSTQSPPGNRTCRHRRSCENGAPLHVPGSGHPPAAAQRNRRP